jgi:MurNAc alpha-1-phosphate uridylyltransferase
MLDRQRLFGLNYPGKWCDVGHPEGIEMAETILRSANV